MKTLDLVKMAMYLALFTVLDLIATNLPLFKMPNGGSLGLATVVLMLAAFDLGWKKGLLVSLLSIVMQQFVGEVYLIRIDQVFLDYVLAFGIYGLSPLFTFVPKDKEGKVPILGLAISAVIVNLVRFGSHVLVGATLWLIDLPQAERWGASVVYSSSYMIPTLIYGAIMLPILYNALWPTFKRQFSK